MDKLLCIKRDNIILLYKASYDIENMKNFINEIQEKYSYKKTDIVKTEICEGVPLSMGKYEAYNFCHIDENYEILEKLEEKKEIYKIKVNVKVDSLIGNTLEEVFVKDEDRLLNMTKFFKVVNHILDIKNNFKFAEIIDLRNRKRKWDDPGRAILNEKDQRKYIRLLEEDLNLDFVILNEKEDKNKNEIYEEVIKKLNSIIEFEQVGMFPIHKDNDEVYKIFEIFGERNKSFEYYFGTLERPDVKYNMNGAIFIYNISDEVLRVYNNFNIKMTRELLSQELLEAKYQYLKSTM